MKKKLFATIVLVISLSVAGLAQKKKQHDTKDMDMKGMDMKGMDMKMKPQAKKSKKPVKKSAKKPVSKKTAGKSTVKKKAAQPSKPHDMQMHKTDGMEGMDMSTGRSGKDTMNMKHMDQMQGMDMSKPGSTDSMKMDHDNMSGMQHNMGEMDMKGDTLKKGEQGGMNMQAHPNMNPGEMSMDHNMDMGNMNGMSHAYSLKLPMNRNGSGTAWLPDASPMYGYMFHKNKWMYMLHGNLFLRYNSQDFTNKGSRGNSKFDAPNWLMFMGQRQVGKNGLFHFSSMLSLDAVIAGGSGYPLLFQSGEAYKGKSIVDRQHPHDLFSELSISYSQAFSKKADVFAYVGYPGEPAIGPVAFMHRPSALDNPDAPISHHWVDATHITFGVATLGVRYGAFKLEGSSFTGREPDEARYDFDKPLFNSWSGRVSFNPSKNWALQVSHGFIKSPEALHPDEDINRTSASAIYSAGFGNNSTVNATATWGQNKSAGHAGENALLLEGSWRKNRLGLHTRYEWVQKSTEELSLDETVYGDHAVFPVNAFTIGFNYDLLRFGQTRLAAGSQFTLYHSDSKLNTLYGKNPMAAEVYLRLYPGRMKMKM